MHIALFVFAIVIVAMLWNHCSPKVVSDAEALKQSAEKAVVAEAEKVEKGVVVDVAKVRKDI